MRQRSLIVLVLSKVPADDVERLATLYAEAVRVHAQAERLRLARDAGNSDAETERRPSSKQAETQ
jgi:hypothetical protein